MKRFTLIFISIFLFCSTGFGEKCDLKKELKQMEMRWNNILKINRTTHNIPREKRMKEFKKFYNELEEKFINCEDIIDVFCQTIQAKKLLECQIKEFQCKIKNKNLPKEYFKKFKLKLPDDDFFKNIGFEAFLEKKMDEKIKNRTIKSFDWKCMGAISKNIVSNKYFFSKLRYLCLCLEKTDPLFYSIFSLLALSPVNSKNSDSEQFFCYYLNPNDEETSSLCLTYLCRIESNNCFREVKNYLENTKNIKNSHIGKCIECLGYTGKDEAVEIIKKYINHKNSNIRGGAILALGSTKNDKAFNIIKSCIINKYTRLRAILALGRFQKAKAFNVLLPLTDDKNLSTREYASGAITRIVADLGKRKHIPLVYKLLKKSNDHGIVSDIISNLCGAHELYDYLDVKLLKNICEETINKLKKEILDISRRVKHIPSVNKLFIDDFKYQESKIRKAYQQLFKRIEEHRKNKSI